MSKYDYDNCEKKAFKLINYYEDELLRCKCTNDFRIRFGSLEMAHRYFSTIVGFFGKTKQTKILDLPGMNKPDDNLMIDIFEEDNQDDQDKIKEVK